MSPVEALERLHGGDVAVGRLDVRPTLDGVEDGLWTLGVLAARGVTVLNPAGALLAAHDKLLTARLLRRAAVPHPRTWYRAGRPSGAVGRAARGRQAPARELGRSVALCTTRAALDAELDRIRHETWYRAHGAILQELVPPVGHDLRLVVAGHRVVGAVRRVAAAGEWRTNVALGAERVAVTPPPAAIGLALAATRALGTVLAGVDLLPNGREGFVVLEVNGAVEFTRTIGRAATSSRGRAGDRARGADAFRTPAPTSTRSTAIDLHLSAERPGAWNGVATLTHGSAA